MKKREGGGICFLFLKVRLVVVGKKLFTEQYSTEENGNNKIRTKYKINKVKTECNSTKTI